MKIYKLSGKIYNNTNQKNAEDLIIGPSRSCPVCDLKQLKSTDPVSKFCVCTLDRWIQKPADKQTCVHAAVSFCEAADETWRPTDGSVFLQAVWSWTQNTCRHSQFLSSSVYLIKNCTEYFTLLLLHYNDLTTSGNLQIKTLTHKQMKSLSNQMFVVNDQLNSLYKSINQ